MSESAIRTQIYTILNAVTDIGKVYDYERWAADWATFINLFKTTIDDVDQIRGWEIGRTAALESGTGEDASIGQTDRSHRFLIRGYMAVNDASATEKTFNSLIESIADAFRGNLTLDDSAQDHDFIQGEVIDHRLFGGVLCHYAELSLTVHEAKEIT